MSYITVSFNGNNYQIPASGEIGPWAVSLNQFLQALGSGAAGINAVNSFSARQDIMDGAAFGPQTAPEQQSYNAQLYCDENDGYLYVIPAHSPGTNPNSPIRVGSLVPVVTAKTANYPIVALDAQVRFTNQGAGGPVTLTLPTAATGLEFYFACTAAQNLVVTGGTVKGPSALTGSTITVYGTIAANRYTSFKLSCYDGSTWLVQELYGSVVVS